MKINDLSVKIGLNLEVVDNETYPPFMGHKNVSYNYTDGNITGLYIAPVDHEDILKKDFSLVDTKKYNWDGVVESPSLKNFTNSSVNYYNAYEKDTNLHTYNRAFNSKKAITTGGVVVVWKKTDDPSWPLNIDVNQTTHLEACKMLVKMLDKYLGLPLQPITFINKDNDPVLRRMFHGTAGTFRPVSLGDGYHGLEYRVISAFPFTLDAIIPLIFNNTILAFKNLLEDYQQADKKLTKTPIKEVLETEIFDKEHPIFDEILKVLSRSSNAPEGQAGYKIPSLRYYKK